MKTARLLLACAALMLCNAAFADPVSYTETFDSGSNMDWGTAYGPWGSWLQSNYDEDGAGYSSTGGYSGGCDLQNVVAGTYNLIFADSDASNGALAGNVNYSALPSLEAYLKWSGTASCSGVLFFASTLDSSTNPVGAPNLTVYYYTPSSFSSSWVHRTAALASSSGWYIAQGSGAWSAALSDVDVVGVICYPYGQGQLMVDNFVGTPEPGLLLTMAPMAGFLGWRLRRRSKRTATG